MVATRTDYSYAAKAGTFAGATTVAAKPGDVIILWCHRIRPHQPAAPPGVATPSTAGYPTATVAEVTVERHSGDCVCAALASGSAGLYQIAIQVRASLADGDWPIQADHRRNCLAAGTILSVHQ